MESGNSFYTSSELGVTVVGIGEGSSAAVDGYVAGVAVVLISILLAG